MIVRRKLLTQMVEQFRNRHARMPEKIVLHPLALPVLALRRSVAAVWAGIPVEIKEIDTSRLTKDEDARYLGVALDADAQKAQLVAFDLK